jgi:hypothetical protein
MVTMGRNPSACHPVPAIFSPFQGRCRDALERRLGLKNPYELLRQVRSGKATGKRAASERTGAWLKARLRAKRSS